MFVCTRSTVAHGGRHAAPLGDAGFPLVLEGILIDSLVPHWGVLEQEHFLGGASWGDLLDLPMVLMISGTLCSVSGGAFFCQAGNACFPSVFEGFRAPAFLVRLSAQ